MTIIETGSPSPADGDSVASPGSNAAMSRRSADVRSQASMTMYPHAGLDVIGDLIHRVQNRRVGAVEADERPRERTIERLALQRKRVPRPVEDGAGVPDLHAERSSAAPGDRVVPGGGTSTRPSDPRAPTIRPLRRPVTKAPTVGPVDRV